MTASYRRRHVFVQAIIISLFLFGFSVGGKTASAVETAGQSAQAPAPQPAEFTYKGRTIHGSPAARNNQIFFDVVKKAIDMSEALPARQQALAARVKDLRYEPRVGDTSRTIADSIIGVYTMGKDPRVPGYISFRANPAMSSPLVFLSSLITNAGYDIWREKFVEAVVTKNKEEADYYARLFAKKDPNLNVRAECTQMKDQFALYTSEQADPREINALSREIADRNCNNEPPLY